MAARAFPEPGVFESPWGIAGGVLAAAQVRLAVDDPGSANYRWLLVLRGQGQASDEQGRSYALSPGALFLRAPRTPHRLRRDAQWLELFLRLPESLTQSFVAQGLIDPQQRFVAPGTVDTLLSQAQRWLSSVRRAESPASNAQLLAATAQLLALIVPTAQDALPALAKALSAQLEQPLSTEVMLARFGDPDGVRERFRVRYGCSPKQFRIRARVQAAMLALERGEAVAAVAAALGWPDASAFCRQFRAITGQTPARWRRA